MSSAGTGQAPANILGQEVGTQAQTNSLVQAVIQISQTLKSAAAQSIFVVTALTEASPYQVTATYGVFSVRPATPAASTVNIPAGGPYFIADGAGTAAAHNITIEGPAGYTISGQSSLVLNTNWGSVLLILDGTNYLAFTALP